jgi:hypothetical protein
MSDKPKKISNFNASDFGDIKRISQYVNNLDRDVGLVVNYLDKFPRFFEQATEPTIQRNTFAFWSNSAAGTMYLLCNISGGQKKAQLT